MACKVTKFTGKSVPMEVAFGCGDALPATGDWLRLAAMRTKENTLEWETADVTADDAVGALRDNLATFLSYNISGDGVVKVGQATESTLTALTKHFANPIDTSGQPVIWVRLTYPDLTFTCFMLLTNLSRSSPYDDAVTFSFEAMSTESDFGLIIADTPRPVTP